MLSDGLELTFYNPNSTNSGNFELAKVRIVHDEHSVPKLRDLDSDTMYKVAIPSFIKEGRSIFEGTELYWSNSEKIGKKITY